MGLALLVAVRDLQWKWRRFVIAVAGSSLAVALALLLSGFRDGVDVEATNTLKAIGADGYVVKEGVNGPFTTSAQLEEAVTAQVAQLAGVSRAAPMVSVRHTITSAPQTDVYLIGTVPGQLGSPSVAKGRPPRAPGEAAVDTAAGRNIGDAFLLGGRRFEVVGLVERTSVWGGVPDVFVPLRDAQNLVLGGRRAATAILTEGFPQARIRGTRVLTVAEANADLKQPVANAITTVNIFRTMIWLVVAAIIGSLLYVSAIERHRDFAVLKAVGVGNGSLVLTLTLQAVTLAAVSAATGLVLAKMLEGLFPSIISFPARTLVLLPLVAVVVGLVGCIAGARRALSIDPATAFAGP